MVRLPKDPVELLELALKALEEVEQDSKYLVSMQHWYLYEEGQVCKVCLAGSVIVKALGITLQSSLQCPSDIFPDSIPLFALNYARMGAIYKFLDLLGYTWDGGDSMEISGYDHREKGESFKRDMRELISRLREFGVHPKD